MRAIGYDQLELDMEPMNNSRFPRLSLDWWAVITALAVVILIRFAVIPAIPW